MYEVDEHKPTEAAQLLAAGAALADRKEFEINDTPAVLVPEGFRVETFEEHREHPIRVEEHIVCNTAEAFVGYILHAGCELSMVFADVAATRFLCILDYHDHAAEIPGWCQHRATYACPHSKEWQLWNNNSGKQMTQTQFAEFIEDNIIDVVDPSGAEMLEVARSLDARTNVRFRSAVRLDNGETQLVYEEVIDGAAGAKGQLKIPQTIKLALRVFQGEDPYAVAARFKYRLKDGVLTMWYELVRPHLIIEDSFAGIRTRIAEQLQQDGINTIDGMPIGA